MANRYWVGGSGTWNTTSTTNWSASSGGAPGATAPGTADVAIFDANSGTGNYTVSTATTAPSVAGITITDPAGTGNTLTFDTTAATITTASNTAVNFTFSSTTGSVVFSGASALILNGGVTISTPSLISFACPLSHTAGVANTWTFNNCSISGNMNKSNASGTLNFGSNFTTSGTITFTNGVVNTSTYTITCQTLTTNCTLNFTSGGVINITGTSGTVFNTLGSGATITGVSLIKLTGNPSSGTTRTITMNSLTTASGAANFAVSAGSDSIITTTNLKVIDLDFTGFSGQWDTTAVLTSFTGNLTLSSTMTVPDNAVNVTMAGTGTQVITSNGVTFGKLLYLNTITGTARFADAFTSTRGIYHSTGTLDLNNKSVTCLVYSNTGSATRALAFGSTGAMYCTNNVATNIPFAIASATGFTLTGTSKVYITNSTAVSTSVSGVPSGTEAQAVNFFFIAGTYPLALSNAIGNVDFTGFSGTINSATRTIYGNWTSSPTMTMTATATATTFSGSSGTKTIRSNGLAFGFPITFDGLGSTWKILDTCNMAARVVTHINGTLDLNGQILSSLSYITAAGTKNITFNGGTMSCSATTTPFNNAAPTGFTTTAGPGGIGNLLLGGSGPTFVGGGSTYQCNFVLNHLGILTVQGSNTFIGAFKNSVQPATVTFTVGTTTTFNGDIKLKGLAGKLITINSTTAGSVATLSHTGSTVSCDYISVKDNTAAGTVPFYAGPHSVVLTNTLNWSNRAPPSANTEFLTLFN